jgi:lipoprotein NlpD
LTLVALLAACAQTPRVGATVEDRPVGRAGSKPAPPVAPIAPTPDVKSLPGAENAGKPGYYTVKPRDTLIQIALDNGQNWRDLAKWNNLGNVNLIEVGQVLRVVQPGVELSTGVTTKPVLAAKVDAPRQLTTVPGAPTTPSAAAPAASTPAVVAAKPPAAARETGDDDVSWGWPTADAVSAGFDEQRNKGLAFSGKAGDAVLAAADGRVIYAGSELRGYGNLIIIKHNAAYLTAYAHNQTLLVKDDQAVRKGQKIAEMGSSDADQVKLHFEVRKQGKPIDPAKLLPAR